MFGLLTKAKRELQKRDNMVANAYKELVFKATRKGAAKPSLAEVEASTGLEGEAALRQFAEDVRFAIDYNDKVRRLESYGNKFNLGTESALKEAVTSTRLAYQQAEQDLKDYLSSAWSRGFAAREIREAERQNERLFPEVERVDETGFADGEAGSMKFTDDFNEAVFEK